MYTLQPVAQFIKNHPIININWSHAYYTTPAGGQENRLISAEKRGWLDGKLETAKNMLADGLPPDQVMRYTGLTPKQTGRLRIGG
jgi:hypothetical protein